VTTDDYKQFLAATHSSNILSASVSLSIWDLPVVTS